MQVERRRRILGDTLHSALSIEPAGFDWISDAERQMRAIEAAVRHELDEAAAAMDAAEPVGDATIRHRRRLAGSSSMEADEGLLYAATRGSRNHRQVADRLNAHAAELEAQLQLAPQAGGKGGRSPRAQPKDGQGPVQTDDVSVM